MIEFTMPSLGADMEDGTFVEWLVQPGETVERGQVVCVVETQKGAVDVEIWTPGVVEALIAEPGQTIAVGGVLARIRAEAGAPTAAAASDTTGEGAIREARSAPVARELAKTIPTAPAGARQRITPAARRRAAELGIDPGALTGSGADGAVTLADVERAAGAGRTAPVDRPAPARESIVPPAKRAPQTATDDARKAAMRDAIAAAMSRSNRDIPHYYLAATLDVEPALKWLEAHNAALPVAERVIFPVLQLRAVAQALRDVPALNGWYEDGAFRAAEGVNVGVAIALRGGGLMVPALRDADSLGIGHMMARLADLLRRARSGQLRSSELTDASITVTNLGDLGVESVHGVIYPPQVALVGFGRVSERPWAEDGRLYATRCLTVTLAADHRASDGAIGARFLSRIVERLKQPESLWES